MVREHPQRDGATRLGRLEGAARLEPGDHVMLRASCSGEEQALPPVVFTVSGVAGSGDLLQSEIGLSSASVQVFQGMLFLVILALDTWSGRLPELGAVIASPFVWGVKLFSKKPIRSGVAHVGV